jgi:putative addiction module component (TIGR02574 family)
MTAPAFLVDTALSLPEDERAELALRLVESLEGAPEEDVEAAWSDEIARRLEDLRAGRTKPVPLEQALAAARARLRSLRG